MTKMGRYVSVDIGAVIEAQQLHLNISKACNEGLIRAVENEKKKRELEKNGGSQGITTPVSNQTLREYHKETGNDKL